MTHRFITAVALSAALALPLFAQGGFSSQAQGAQPVAVQVAQAKPAPAKAPVALTAQQILTKAVDSLFPELFTAKIESVQFKPGQPNNSFKMMLYKRGKDTVRADYVDPPLQAGQKLLRNKNQMYMFMPSTKKAIKLSPKQALGGSDFNNGDIMYLNLEDDYVASISKEDATTWTLDLKAKDRTVSYDLIKYTIEKKELRSVKQEFYTLSGKLIKTLEFQEYKDYGGLKRPSLFVMRSNLAQGMYTQMRYLQFEAGKTLPESAFRPDALSKQ